MFKRSLQEMYKKCTRSAQRAYKKKTKNVQQVWIFKDKFIERVKKKKFKRSLDNYLKIFIRQKVLIV